MGIKRARSSYGKSSMIRYQNAMLRSSRMSNRLARSAITTHSFKRIGTPIIFSNNNAVDAAGAMFSFIQGAAFVSMTPATPANLDAAANNAVQFGGTLKFSLAQLVAVADITALFDNYRIKKVRLQFSYSSNSADVNMVTSTLTLPLMDYAFDPDDSVQPSSQTAVQEIETCKTKRLGHEVFYLDVYPRAQQVIGTAAGASAVGGLLPTKTWLDCQSTNVEHYGVKFWLRHWPYPAAAGNSKQAVLTITPTYYIECRNTS